MFVLLQIIFYCDLLFYRTASSRTQINANGQINDYKYMPTWESLDTRELPEWFNQAKVGIYVNWGIFSVPSYKTDWFWYRWKNNDMEIAKFMRTNYKPGFTYQNFGSEFTAELYDPGHWADIFVKSGANYVISNAKHHDGYTMWPSKYSFNWNSMDVGPKRDLLGELANAVSAEHMHFGVYYSLYEWFHPLYMSDRRSNFTKTEFVRTKLVPEMREMVAEYRPEIVLVDGEWEAKDSYFDSRQFLAWLYNESPVKSTVIANDRWGANIACHHGDVYLCDSTLNPGVFPCRKCINLLPLDQFSTIYRRDANAFDYLSMSDIIRALIVTISCGGSILLNIGATKDGIIPPIFQERLLNLGQWLAINKEAIYNTYPWVAQNDSLNDEVWYTARYYEFYYVYAFVLNWPEGNRLTLGNPNGHFNSELLTVTLLGNGNEELEWSYNASQDYLSVTFPSKSTVESEWAWVLKIRLP